MLYFLGFAGFGVWPLLGIFLVPLWWALERTRARGLGAPALTGFVFGLVAYAGGHLWLWRIVDVFLGGNVWLGAALCTVYGVWFGLGFAAYAALFHGIRGRGWPVAVAGVAPLVAVEWLHPQLFPVYAGSGLVAVTPLAQIADLGGPLLLSALIASVNAVAAETGRWLCGARGRPLVPWLAGVALMALVLGYGRVRAIGIAEQLAAAPALRVGVVQANLGLLEKRTHALVSHRRHLEQTRELLADGPLDLVVWPETAYVRGVRGPLPVSGHLVRGDLFAPLLFGGTLVRHEGARRVTANAALLVDGDGMVRAAYEKNLLIPLAEYVPFATLVPGLVARLPHVQDFSASDDLPALALGPWRISTPICYEAIRPDFVHRMVTAARPHLLVTLANDAWFGDSQEPWLHLQLARMRAIEHRRYLVRATNSGVSAIIDPIGRLVAHTGVLTRENLRGTVRPLEIATLYAALGHWPGAVAVVLVALTLALGRRPRAS
jgi:apolipoprotein N-acyltransferase